MALCSHGRGRSRASPPPRRERRKLEVRARIVEAALELFRERGFDATKVPTSASARTSRTRPSSTTSRPSRTWCARSRSTRSASCCSTSSGAQRGARAGVGTRDRLARFFERISTASRPRPDVPRAGDRDRPCDHDAARAPSRRAGCTTRSARSSRDGLAGRRRHAPPRRRDAQAEMMLGAYYVLIFNCAQPRRLSRSRSRRAAVARFLGDALCARHGEE